MSESVCAGLPSRFQSETDADVCIRFHLERTPEEQQNNRQQPQNQGQAGVQGQQQQRHGAEGAEDHTAAGLCFVGDPLPAHKIILTLGSTYLRSKLYNMCWQGAEAGASLMGAPHGYHTWVPTMGIAGAAGCDGHDGTGGGIAALPQVLVPLSSEAEEPFARQAVKYIYTGSLSADLGFEALQRVRQQACYLGIEPCPQACDSAMVAWLHAAAANKPLKQGQQQQQDGTCAHKTTTVPRVLQAYACHALFPEPGVSPDAASFKPVRSALATQLVSHFGDAVAALTQPVLYRQLLQLPAVAVRELLAADDFGTDSEDSVFLMLACWLEANTGEEGREGDVSAETRAELCGLVRLHHLSNTYLHHVLPAYDPFDIGRKELGFLFRFVGTIGQQDRNELMGIHPQRKLSPWYCSLERRKVVPGTGRTVAWSISRGQLEQGLRDMVGGEVGCAYVRVLWVLGQGAGLGKRALLCAVRRAEMERQAHAGPGRRWFESRRRRDHRFWSCRDIHRHGCAAAAG